MFRFPIDDELELRLLDDRHTEELFALTDANREHLLPWLPWIKSTQSPTDTSAFIRDGLYQYAANNGFQAGIWRRSQLAGVVGYHYWNWANRKTELGYWLGAGFQGYGIMTRACRALIAHAFDELQLNRVEIRCNPANIRSRAIPQRLGFVEEGTVRQAEWLHDQYGDLLVYGMLRAEWPSAR